jgi:hypothetical protein
MESQKFALQRALDTKEQEPGFSTQGLRAENPSHKNDYSSL